MSEPAAVYHVIEWQGCYSDSWQGVITPDSFAHPAKFARGLIHRIYAHMIERGYIAAGDSVVDPFGGIAAGAYDALLFGLHWVGVELEERFCLLGNANIDKYRHDLRMLNGRLGSARLLQGDSRRLAEVVGAGMGAVVSSPPFESSLESQDEAFQAAARPGRTIQLATYGSTPGNIGNDQGETFWAASRVIVEQTYSVLKPGGYAAWVTKDFVRKGQRVPFSDQWEQLCAAVGFAPVERIHALLVEDHGTQLNIFGGAVAKRTERKSFFRRLAEKKGSPRIDHEDVIIMRKPL